MKQKNNRQEVDTLYVLGAGASYALTYVNPKKRDFVRSIAPLDKDFIECLKKNKNTGWKKNATHIIMNDWFDRDPIANHGLEQAIIKRVSQFEFLSNVHQTRIRGKCSNEDYLNNLSHLITEYLQKCKSNSSGNTKKFINNVFPSGISPDVYKNRVITFNYDTLIERPLIERGLSRKKLYFDRIVNKKSSGLRRNTDKKFSSPLILKLHGSINWRCDRTHFDQMISGNIDHQEKVVIWTDDKGSPKPEDDVSPLIIPPIPNKPITATSLFNFLWTTAYEYLHEAKKLVIVGYSCPPTDTLARTMFTHFKSKNIKEIFVVDPNAIALKNYRDMFDPKLAIKAKWRYYSSFAEYIDGEIS
jgi:hypothetical protein